MSRWVGTALLASVLGCGFRLAPPGGGPPGDGSAFDSPFDPDARLIDAAPIGCFRQLDALRYFSCATRTDGTAWCWGDNATRQLGDNSTTQRLSPVRVGTLTGILEPRGSLEVPLPTQKSKAKNRTRTRQRT